jgi:hypothetical protein
MVSVEVLNFKIIKMAVTNMRIGEICRCTIFVDVFLF